MALPINIDDLLSKQKVENSKQDGILLLYIIRYVLSPTT